MNLKPLKHKAAVLLYHKINSYLINLKHVMVQITVHKDWHLVWGTEEWQKWRLPLCKPKLETRHFLNMKQRLLPSNITELKRQLSHAPSMK